MKKFSYVLGSLALLPSIALAEDANGTAVTVDQIIDTSNLRTTIITNITPWVAMGLGVAITLFLVMLGWRKLKGLSKSSGN